MATVVYPQIRSSPLGKRRELGSMAGRPSAIFNEDDFDYAIELQPDDEYRLVAEALPDIVDFDEIEINPEDLLHLDDNDYDREEGEGDGDDDGLHDENLFNQFDLEANRNSLGVTAKRVSSLLQPTRASTGAGGAGWDGRFSITGLGATFGGMGTMGITARRSSVNGHGNGNGALSRQSLVSKEEFMKRLQNLADHRKWVEKAARKSSLGVARRLAMSEKAAQDMFLVRMAGGILVRRHQAHKMAEVVRLFSTTGCREISWETPDQQAQEQEGLIPVHKDRGLFDCCIAICGCGDHLISGTGSTQVTPAASTSSSARSSSGWCGWWGNWGFQRAGSFHDSDLLAVQPAGKEDPTAPGLLGTEGLRGSRDCFAVARTFSLVLRDPHCSSGYTSLDLECDDDESYLILVKGFSAILNEQLGLQQEESSSHPSSISSHDLWLQLWKKMVIPASSNGRTKKAVVDPMAELFAPPSRFGLLPSSSPLPGTSSSCAGSPFYSFSSRKKLPVAQFLGWKSPGTQIWARLKMAGLEVKAVFSYDLSRILLKLRCPAWRLEEMAEQMRLKLKSRSGYLRPFRVSRRDSYQGLGLGGSLFRSSDRQRIIDHLLRCRIVDGGAELDEHTELGRHIVQRFPLHMSRRLIELRHQWVTFWKREPAGEVAPPLSFFRTSWKILFQEWRAASHHLCENILSQPLDNIAEYFGEGVAFYFAFLAFTTQWLVFPALLGVGVFIAQVVTGRLDHWLCLPYAIFITIWGAFLLTSWRQKQSILAHRWGVLEVEVEEQERPQFEGSYYLDDLTGELRKDYPMRKRLLRYLITVPVLLVALGIVLLILATLFYSQDQMLSRYDNANRLDFSPSFPFVHALQTMAMMSNNTSSGTDSSSSSSSSGEDNVGRLQRYRDPEYWVVAFFYPSLYAIIVSILTHIFHWLSHKLNSYENHRTASIFEGRLVLKVFSCHFATIFSSLYYPLFFAADQDSALMRITSSIYSLLTVGVIWNLVVQVVLPALGQRMRRFRLQALVAATNRKIYAAKELGDRQQQQLERKRQQELSQQSSHQEEEGAEGLEERDDLEEQLKGDQAEQNAEEEEGLEERLEKRVRYLDQARSSCWEEALQSPYSSFSDYSSLVVQLCLVLFFAALCPLAPFLALLHNLVLIRCQAYKLCYTRQRPIAQKVGGVGVWSEVLQVLSVVAVLTQIAIFTFATHILGSLDTAQLLLACFLYEQAFLLFRYWLDKQLPAVPRAVQRAVQRERKSLSRRSILRSLDAANKVARKKKEKEEKGRKKSSFMETMWAKVYRSPPGGGGSGGGGSVGAGIGSASCSPYSPASMSPYSVSPQYSYSEVQQEEEQEEQADEDDDLCERQQQLEEEYEQQESETEEEEEEEEEERLPPPYEEEEEGGEQDSDGYMSPPPYSPSLSPLARNHVNRFSPLSPHLWDAPFGEEQVRDGRDGAEDVKEEMDVPSSLATRSSLSSSVNAMVSVSHNLPLPSPAQQKAARRSLWMGWHSTSHHLTNTTSSLNLLPLGEGHRLPGRQSASAFPPPPPPPPQSSASSSVQPKKAPAMTSSKYSSSISRGTRSAGVSSLVAASPPRQKHHQQPSRTRNSPPPRKISQKKKKTTTPICSQPVSNHIPFTPPPPLPPLPSRSVGKSPSTRHLFPPPPRSPFSFLEDGSSSTLSPPLSIRRDGEQRSTPGAVGREQVPQKGKRRSSQLQRYEEDVENRHDAVNKTYDLPLSTPPRGPSASCEKTKKSSGRKFADRAVVAAAGSAGHLNPFASFTISRPQPQSQTFI